MGLAYQTRLILSAYFNLCKKIVLTQSSIKLCRKCSHIKPVTTNTSMTAYCRMYDRKIQVVNNVQGFEIEQYFSIDAVIGIRCGIHLLSSERFMKVSKSRSSLIEVLKYFSQKKEFLYYFPASALDRYS